MNAVNLKLVRGIFGALVVGALGFGATQALASPVRAAVFGCTATQQQQCQNYCGLRGAQGYCSSFGLGGYDCVCYVEGPEA